MDDLIELVIRIILYPFELIARAWLFVVEMVIELIGNIAPDVMPSIPELPTTVSWPRIGIAITMYIVVIAVVSGALAAASWLGLIGWWLAGMLVGLMAITLFVGTGRAVYRLYFDPPRARGKRPPS